ncbi:MAG: hypothetical protein F6K42_05550 [Leptolyngbya sp. SIO1D8]|nr:hypothetical protein [Leptolyngbya sp. SIO1D8]
MWTSPWLIGSLMGLGLFVGSSVEAIAQTPSPEPETVPEETFPEETVPEETPPDTDSLEATPQSSAEDFQTYTLPSSFSLQIPAAWIAEGTEAERSAVITNYNPERTGEDLPQPTDIRTEIMFIDEHPDSFVNREIAAIIEQEYPVRRYLPVKVNDRTGFRIWVSDLPSEYTRQIITFVGYASYGTAMIVTYYNADSMETEALIEEVHDSFELLF